MSALFVGLKSTVVAIDRTSGETLWTTKLKGSDFVSVSVDNGALFAAARGHIYRLDPTTGDVLWSNSLPGLGFGIVSFAGTSAGPAAENRRREQAAVAAGTS